ncbi:MAG: HAD family hydrolase [Candidatus Marinimicrobia bacterium]|nr:HAD family hydrolase [Candidatus Neomarinimicrobiota bacterium]MBL7108725.1 HAD family hydrolase [Candidatus Neomarinimicrobiota bacterium]
MKSIKQIIWDWNGTLLDDAWLCVQSMNKVLQRRQMPELTSARYQEVFDFPVIKYYELLGFDFKKEPFTIVGTEFINEYYKNSHKLDLQEGAKKVFNTIKEKGISQSILSAQKQSSLEKLLKDFQIDKYFEHIIGLDNHYAHSKTENGLKLIETLPQEPNEVLLVGDTVHDFEVAEKMKVKCVLIPSGHHSRKKLENTDSIIANSVNDIVQMLD